MCKVTKFLPFTVYHIKMILYQYSHMKKYMSIIRYPFFHLKKRAVIIGEAKRQAPKAGPSVERKGKCMEKKASFVGRLLSENQMSEAFINSMFLALSGGFQDAYTYNCRDEVFSNAQTGNVVLMSQNFLEGKLYGRPSVSSSRSSFCDGCISGRKISRSITGMQRGCTGGRYFSRRKL